LCRALLERHDETEQERAWVFSEDERRLYASIAPRNANAAQKKKWLPQSFHGASWLSELR